MLQLQKWIKNDKKKINLHFSPSLPVPVTCILTSTVLAVEFKQTLKQMKRKCFYAK